MSTLTQKAHITGRISGLYQHCRDCDAILMVKSSTEDLFYKEGLRLGVIIGQASGAVSRYLISQDFITTPTPCVEQDRIQKVLEEVSL
jgi:hypothetical protein